MFKKLNQQIQKHFGFYGPKWWCWLQVVLGSIVWFVEGPFKVLGYAEYGPGYQALHYIFEVSNSGNHLYYLIVLIIFCIPVLSTIIIFPSFMFLLSRVAVDHYQPSSVKKYYLMYFTILTSPIWFNLLIGS